jgi:hypothetical protein
MVRTERGEDARRSVTSHEKKSRGPERAAERAKEKLRFLELLAAGSSVIRAAAAVDVARRTLYEWRAKDPEFAQAWDEAWEQGTDFLEQIALDRAEKGSDLLLIFLMKGRRPGRYRDNVRHEVDAKLTIDVADARLELAKRFGMIEDHRAQHRAQRALPSPTRRSQAQPEDGHAE